MGLIAKIAWIALPALAGFGVLSQVSRQGTGTNPGGKATGDSLSASNNRSAVIKLNEHGLPWPENPTPATVLKDYSWEQEFKQPGSAKNLPYFGKATPAEIVDHINDVWNATKYVKHIPGQTVAQTWQRIKKEVDPVINSLGYTPTEAHKQIMYDAGIATFIATNVIPGEPDQTIPELNRNKVLSYVVNNEKAGIDHANALLRQVDLHAVCANITALDGALKHEAGIFAVINSVHSRSNPQVVVNYDESLINHSVVIALYPTKRGTQVLKAKRMEDPLSNYSRVLSDPAKFPLSSSDKSNLDSLVRFPNMPYFSAGAKGDDVWRINFGAVNVSFTKFPDGSVVSKVAEFGSNGRFTFGKPLDVSFGRLFSTVKEFNEVYKR